MKGFIMVLLGALLSTACFVQTHEGRTTSRVQSRSCPPAHHWENGACVHNGKAKGHYK